MSEVLTCPFCNSTRIRFDICTASIHCLECGCRGPSATRILPKDKLKPKIDREMLEDAWNTRKGSPTGS